MIHLVFADAALELVPSVLLSHPSVKKYAKRFNKRQNIILDDTYHHSAMNNLDGRNRRGRPDIVHFCLLEALGSPLNLSGKLRVYVHTVLNHVIYFDPQVRLPRNQERFKGLMEEVLARGKSKNDLIKMRPSWSFGEFMDSLGCKEIIGFSKRGKKGSLSGHVKSSGSSRYSCLVIGAFPEGDFSPDVRARLTKLLSIFPESLDAWVATSRILGEIERIQELIF